MTTAASVTESWARIDRWLARHAPDTHARLRPPASDADIEELARTMGVTLPDDLVASLRCHDGVEWGQGALELSYYGPLSSVADMVRATSRLRRFEAEFSGRNGGEDGELTASWQPEWLLITLGIGAQASDGMFLSCRPGPHYGRPGRYFDEDVPSFTEWPTLRDVLAELADAMEDRGVFHGRVPLAVEGELLWEDRPTVVADPVSVLALAEQTAEPEAGAGEDTGPVGVLGGGPQPSAGYSPDGHGGQFRVAFVRAEPPRPDPLPAQPDILFAEGLSPDELLRRLGALPATVRPRTRATAERSGASLWAAYRPLVRVGTAGGWAYAVQEAGEAQFGRPEVLRTVSAGTRAVALTKDGPRVSVTLTEDGTPRPDAGRTVEAPPESGPEPAFQTPSPYPPVGRPRPHSAAYAPLLTGLAEEYGLVHDPAADADTELTSALLLPRPDDLRKPWPLDEVRGFYLDELFERTEPERLRGAFTAQLARLAAETGLTAHPEITAALAGLQGGQDLTIDPDGPLDLRLRTLAAEGHAAHMGRRARHGRTRRPIVQPEDQRAWAVRAAAGRALRAFLEQPLRMAAVTVLQQRMSPYWRDELAADLDGQGHATPGCLGLPPGLRQYP
ncbi:SMI1/KNR4 family protein [Streptomyces sp. NPDC048290]|uniref:SMI1/KNR4 family protein n=1 Tax=Streptomyces sp. NPDC048290 TaxID=3155811 RepID=UPI0034445AE0